MKVKEFIEILKNMEIVTDCNTLSTYDEGREVIETKERSIGFKKFSKYKFEKNRKIIKEFVTFQSLIESKEFMDMDLVVIPSMKIKQDYSYSNSGHKYFNNFSEILFVVS